MSETSAASAVPQHLGLILDGNRRWAKARGVIAQKGHLEGYKTLKSIVDIAFDKGVRYVSAYIFSTENWSRTQEEVSFLMDLTLRMVVRDLKEIQDKNIKLIWLGSNDKVSEKLQKALNNAVEATKNNTRGTLALCFNYGGQSEIVNAVKLLVKDGVEPSEKAITERLYSPSLPPIDLLVRTSGEKRISNFMLWRAAYSELYFTDTLWPDFDETNLDEALAEYAARSRRFGG